MTAALSRLYPWGVIALVVIALLGVLLVGIPAFDFGRISAALGYRDVPKYVSMIVHFTTAIVWLGGLSIQLLALVAPGLEERQRERMFAMVVPWMWISLVALLPTGVYQTINNPVTEQITSYEMAQQLRARPYGQVLVLKHITVLITVMLAAASAFVALPRWRIALDRGQPTSGVVGVLRILSVVSGITAVVLLFSVTRLVLFGH